MLYTPIALELFLYRLLLARLLLSFPVPRALDLDSGFARAAVALYQLPLPLLVSSMSIVSSVLAN